jgi:alkylation response protein AidB-like acyl-CoA dehydrogenase
MNFDFSDEQKSLADQARRFLEAECPTTAVRAVLDGGQTHDAALWRGIADMGFLGVVIPERFGGLGLSYL